MADRAATFSASADAYDRFMGRYSRPLAARMVELVDPRPGERVVDVGCGPGALTAALAARVGAENVAAVDPTGGFVAACRGRVPGADVRVARAEQLPFGDGEFRAALSQLVFHFVSDPPAGAAEMRRVLQPGGRAAACVGDLNDGMTLLRSFWDAASALEPTAPDERRMRFTRDGELAALWREAGFRDVESGALEVATTYESFDELWATVLEGVGPAGTYALALDEPRRAELRAEVRRRLGEPGGSFELPARAWYAVGRA